VAKNEEGWITVWVAGMSRVVAEATAASWAGSRKKPDFSALADVLLPKQRLRRVNKEVELGTN
jgi:hypothetical protein